MLAAFAEADVRKDGFKVGPGATEGGSVACKDGQVPAGGGFELDQTLSGPAGPERLGIHSSFPSRGKWKVEAYNFDGTTKRGSAIAVCVKDNDLFVRTKTAQEPDDVDEVQATAKCPPGSKALGGGGEGPGQNQWLRGSFPAEIGRSWGARFENVYGEKVKAFVVCDPSSKRVEIVEDIEVSDPGRRRGGTQTVTAKAKCKSGFDPVGGGHFSSDSSTVYLESRPARGAWRVSANATEGASVNAYAVCRK